jgi:cytidine deaminase
MTRAISHHLQHQLVEAALGAREYAYAPYSKFAVGAAVATDEEQIFRGANVENISFGLTNCAERVAVQAAIASGARQIIAVAIASRGGVTPCGACRQVLAEFGEDIKVFLVDIARPDQVNITSLADLLPGAFRTEL